MEKMEQIFYRWRTKRNVFQFLIQIFFILAWNLIFFVNTCFDKK